MKHRHGSKLRRWLGVVCALALICAWVAPRKVHAQASDATVTKPKSASSKKTATAKSSANKTSSTHTASHSSTAKSPKTASASATRSGKTTHATYRKGSRRKPRGQQKIDPERAQSIQEALIREHYLSGTAAGTWNQASEDAMRRYQADHGWQSKTVPDSRALISLGLGPSHDHLLNPESAMTTEPPAPHAASLSPVSHSAEPGPRLSTDPATTTPSNKDASVPQ